MKQKKAIWAASLVLVVVLVGGGAAYFGLSGLARMAGLSPRDLPADFREAILVPQTEQLVREGREGVRVKQ